MMYGTGEGVGWGAGAEWDRTRGDGVGVIRIGGVGALGAGRRINVEGSGSRSGVPSTGL